MRNVVLVLGAGASCTYGNPKLKLPTTHGLKLRIINDTDLNGSSASAGHTSGFDFVRSKAELVKAQFAASGQYSIDRFLERQPDHLLIGKRLIAAALLPIEAGAIADRSIASGWYQWLFNQLASPTEPILKTEGFSIVTFNYDRTLEFSLITMLINSFGHEPSAAERAVAQIPIHHVYGRLVSEAYFDPKERLYEVPDPRAFVEKSGEAIKIISTHRDEEQDSELQKARSAISVADCIVFLGFGFDETNLRRLGFIPDAAKATSGAGKAIIYGTTVGLGNSRRHWARNFMQYSAIAPRGVSLDEHDMHCESYLTEHVDLGGWLS